uniref:Protein kinase domain-containing protein n=1 Tax=Oryza glumipatula TaxID=40148 RepID=A0A0D9Y2D1_9ORYZ
MLGLAINHCMFDGVGVGVMQFVNSWGETARGVPLSVPPALDRALLRARDPPQVAFLHHEFAQIDDGDDGDSPAQDGAEPLLHRSFRFTPESIAHVKALVAVDSGGGGRAPTTFEALGMRGGASSSSPWTGGRGSRRLLRQGDAGPSPARAGAILRPACPEEKNARRANGQDLFDISLVDGFNVPMDFLPAPPPNQSSQGAPPCSKGPRCPANVTAQCPGELRAHGGCNNACRVFKQDKYCCTGNGTNTCEPTTYSLPFVRMCPDAYSYSRNDASSPGLTCPSGTNYQIIFCPPIDLTSSSPASIAVAANNRQGKKVIAGIIVASVIGSTSVLTIVIAYTIIKRRTRRRREIHEEEQEFEEITLQGMPRRFTFQQLQEATDQFRDKLGEGGFGSVFLGQIGDEIVAVKRLDRSGQGMREFLAEVQTIGSIHHINLLWAQLHLLPQIYPDPGD